MGLVELLTVDFVVVALMGLGFGFDGGRSIVIYHGFDEVGLGCVVYFGGMLVWVWVVIVVLPHQSFGPSPQDVIMSTGFPKVVFCIMTLVFSFGICFCILLLCYIVFLCVFTLQSNTTQSP